MELAMIRQTFGEESISHTWVFEWKSPHSQRPKKARQGKGKVKSMCEDFTQNTGEKGTGCCITTMHHLILSFTAENF
jgi:hypothetical protein